MGIRIKSARRQSGQAMIETVLLMPLLLTIVLNAVNIGYVVLMALNLEAAPRVAAEYSIMGFETPAASFLPAAGPSGTNTSVSYLAYHDMTGSISSPTTASVQVCSQTVGISAAGVATCTSFGAASFAGLGADPDPEAPKFVLNRVDVKYTFNPIIPGRIFNLGLIPSGLCSASGAAGVVCTFHRQVSMRAMN
jgi:Flp pilus assembly protein TadG